MVNTYGIYPIIIFAVITLVSVPAFVLIWHLLNKFDAKIFDRWAILRRLIENFRRKGENRLIKRYGLAGLFVVMAIPVPTIGVYGGTVLTWTMGMKWRTSLIAVVSGATIYNTILLLSSFGIMKAVGLSI